MKKNRLLFLLPLLASFVLTSCDMLSNLNFNGPRKKSSQEDSEVLDDSDDYSMPSSSSSKSSSKSSGRTSSSSSKSSSSAHQHEWADWIVVNEATCTTYGMKKRECTICGQIQTDSIPAYGHDFGEMTYSIEPTCTSSGVGQRECSRCHETLSEIVPARGHDWNEWDIINYPTCTTDGSGRHTCRVCGAYEQQVILAYGHSYDENDVNWTSQPTCTQDGVGYVRCNRCNEQVTVSIPALGHNQLLLDYRSPQSGTANTRVYRCQRCGETTLSFGADALSTESKKTLVEEWNGEGEIGYRFWGRPIGNAVQLDENGNADQNEHTPVFDPNEKGSYFEIIFNLSAQQAAALGQCFLYCDAKPADYMNQNGLDFWANNKDFTDWTPGLYLEGDRYGQLITDYRYRLYVDNQPVDFDPGIKAPVPSGNPRGEYVMPYIFNLHTGINKFSLHMAGGYRSLFYNFTFRPLEHPHTHTYDAWAGDNDYHWRVCSSADCFAAEGTQYNKAAHTFTDTVVTSYPTHSSYGTGTKTCTVCGKTVEVVIPKIAHDWVEGEPLQNFDETPKNTIPLTCSCGKIGAKMNTSDYSDCEFGSDSDRQPDNLRPSSNRAIVYNIVVGKAGNYSISIGAKCKTNATVKMSQRQISVRVNGVDATVTDWGELKASEIGLNAETLVQLELVPNVALVEGVNQISITVATYRLYYGGDLVIEEN